MKLFYYNQLTSSELATLGDYSLRTVIQNVPMRNPYRELREIVSCSYNLGNAFRRSPQKGNIDCRADISASYISRGEQISLTI